MTENAYEKLGGGIEVLTEFYEYWMTEEEAEFLTLIPDLPESLDSIAEKAGMTREETKKMLQTLIEKAMVDDFDAEDLDERLYGRGSLVSWTECYLSRYVDLDDPNPREIDVKLAKFMEAMKADYVEQGPKLGRLIPMEKAISDTRGVISTSEASKIIDEASCVSVAPCPCRSTGHLAGTGCKTPMEVCFSLNDYARYQAEYGFAREVTKEWAKKTLRECEELGLPHLTDNIRGNDTFICNCCPCHCAGLVGFANAEQNVDVDVETLKVSRAVVDEGPLLGGRPRFRPISRGRAVPIRKRLSHIRITISAPDKEET